RSAPPPTSLSTSTAQSARCRDAHASALQPELGSAFFQPPLAPTALGRTDAVWCLFLAGLGGWRRMHSGRPSPWHCHSEIFLVQASVFSSLLKASERGLKPMCSSTLSGIL